MGADTRVIQEAMRRLRRRREQLDMSQAEVAEAAGVNPSYVGLLERGERVPSLDVLVSLASALGLALPELFAPADTKPPKELVEVAAIRSVLAKWPAEHRKAAVRVVGEMDKLLRTRAPKS